MRLSVCLTVNLINTRKACSAIFAFAKMLIRSVASKAFSFFRDEHVCCQNVLIFGRSAEIKLDNDEDISMAGDFNRF